MSHLDGTDRQVTAARRLGDALRALQQRSGTTLRALEQQVLISDSSLSRYFRGATVPPWPVVRDICRALDTDPTAYRVLWEAADADQNRPPSGQGTGPDRAPSGSVPAPSPEPGGPSAPSVAPEPGSAGPGPVPVVARRWPWAVAGLLTGVALGVAAVLALTSSEAPEAARVFRNKATDACLDDSVEGLRVWPCNGLRYQEWEFRPYGDGPGDLRNRATGACLDHDGTAPRARSCDRSAAQGWTLTGRADGSVQLRHLATGTCLTGGPGAPAAGPCDGSDPQRWT
ncbi:helix-turn-helix domain-containing protein [Streptomyces sp. NPDC006512]|uniref:helix-turn-helix domain-containing protein n=1 Tax=Streptomyces sp. NPDC006512 TaxID=3154307 RepID=UPI0033BEAA56